MGSEEYWNTDHAQGGVRRNIFVKLRGKETPQNESKANASKQPFHYHCYVVAQMCK